MGDIEVFNTVVSLQSKLQSDYKKSKVGLVPTMGALHEGHMTLVQKSIEQNDCTIVSIFVNPTQFNNPSDLEKYPRNMDRDLELLKEQGDVIVFAPSVLEVYPDNYQTVKLDLGQMGLVMEGKFREGHFDGVVNVVNRLFEIVSPTHAYFGLKDFQQLAVIQFMTEKFSLDVKIVGCEIFREKSGLASSSRNQRLDESQLDKALVISLVLNQAKMSAKSKSIQEVIDEAKGTFEASSLELEYFQIVNPRTLMDLDEWIPGAHACVAAYCGKVRLLDNLQMTST
ncbi:MAG: pantoate--beta-alanine ligase [Crocinitomicaceae bacterium]|nr:pantoate--beta-alanine ligase [Crocinitomicaceae bacterium]